MLRQTILVNIYEDVNTHWQVVEKLQEEQVARNFGGVRSSVGSWGWGEVIEVHERHLKRRQKFKMNSIHDVTYCDADKDKFSSNHLSDAI